MIDDLTSSLPSSSINRALDDIDSRSRDTREIESGDIVIGPFSVLQSRRPSDTPLQRVSQGRTQDDLVPELDSAPHELNLGDFIPEPSYPVIPRPLSDLSPATFDSFASLDDSLQWADLFGLSFDNALEPFVGALGSPREPFPIGHGDFHSCNEPMSSYVSGETTDNVQASLIQPVLPTDIVMAQAQRLLTHF